MPTDLRDQLTAKSPAAEVPGLSARESEIARYVGGRDAQRRSISQAWYNRGNGQSSPQQHLQKVAYTGSRRTYIVRNPHPANRGGRRILTAMSMAAVAYIFR
jgi:hypothetical protein